jgi:hypothetical protein
MDKGYDRPRRIRDAVEAALSNIILLGREEQVRLAERAARELLAGHPVHTHELVVSLRDFIRDALDLAPLPANISIPMQGLPVRPALAYAERVKAGVPARAVMALVGAEAEVLAVEWVGPLGRAVRMTRRRQTSALSCWYKSRSVFKIRGS